jgi:hypothetical protein
MSRKPFGTMDLVNLIMAVVVTSLVGLLWGRPGAVAGGAGASLAFVNLWVLRRLGSRAVARAAAGDKAQASWLMAAFALKMVILFGLVWVAIRVYNLALVPFAIGISLLPISLVFAGLWVGSTAGEGGRA